MSGNQGETMDGDRPAGVCAVIDPERGEHGTMHLHGTLDPASFHRALHRVAETRPGTRHPGPRLVRHAPGLHSVELPAGAQAPVPGAVGLLADLLTAADPAPGSCGAPAGPPCRTLPRTEPVTPLQRRRLADTLAWPGHQAEQLRWRWYGPLDTERLTAAWHAVGERESILRTAFVWDPRPRAVVFDRPVTDVVRHPHATAIRRAALRERERARAFDLRRPAAVRLALLDSGPEDAAAPFTDILLTYHRALLDSWSARLLMRECCRAYLAGGTLPGGPRRPDLGDCARLLTAQDPGPYPGPYPGQDLGPDPGFRHGSVRRPAAPPPLSPPDPGQDPGFGPGSARHRAPSPVPPSFPFSSPPSDPGRGRAAGSGPTGVLRTVLSPARSTHLAHWAARWGVAESSVLQAVWALLRYRAGATAPATVPAPATIGFGLDFPGRGLLLEGIEGVPGPFENALPLTLALHPGLRLPRLLHTLRDVVMDLSAYEWNSAGAPDGAGPGARAGGLLAFDCGPRPETACGDELAAQGIRLEEQEAAGTPAGYALRLRAGHDTRRALVLTCAYDRDLIDSGTVRTLLEHTVRLLRLLPATATAATTVADALALLPPTPTPRVPDGPPARDRDFLVPLRGPLAPAAATVCLLDVPGAPRTGHRELIRHYRGPEALTALRLSAGRHTDHTDALARLARGGGRLVLGGHSGTGALACELARQLTAAGVRPPLVVVGGAHDDPGAPRHLAEVLHRAAARAARP
ncbi:peptide synthase condensation domain-containing protein [Streptomyces sp. NPDC051997]|uniref:peptide synthase condensation domain-containing protein n=1 Tax=Streptomyces sp. NPDC051997 TaxID=3155611 RepID=UPI003427E224